MAQLSRFRFQKIGSLHAMEDGSSSVGPCSEYRGNDDGTLRAVAFGPFDTAAAYFRDGKAEGETKSVWGIAKSKLTDFMTPFPPGYDSTDGFVLSHPDLDSQNVTADDQGNIMGIIDWDLYRSASDTVPTPADWSRFWRRRWLDLLREVAYLAGGMDCCSKWYLQAGNMPEVGASCCRRGRRCAGCSL